MIDKQAEVDQVTETLDDLLKKATVVVDRMNAVLLRAERAGTRSKTRVEPTEEKEQ